MAADPTDVDIEVALDQGWELLRAGAWEDARRAFAEVIEHAPSPEAYEGASWAAWWLDDADAVFEAREQAYRLYRERDDNAAAARMATWFASDNFDFRGAVSVASGWLDRARRMLEATERGPDHGWLAMHQGYIDLIRGETASAREYAGRAAAIGREFGVPDLEMLGLALEGSALVSRASVKDGMRCLDEATAIALSDEATVPISGAWTCCFLVTACTRVLDFERAFEWCDRIAEFADRYGSRYMLGFCRAEYAQVHLWRGDWSRAEAALDESIVALSASRPPMLGGPLTSMAELRRRQGRPEEAEQLLERAGTSRGERLCRARMALDRGDAELAVELADRALRSVDETRLVDRVPSYEVLLRAHLAADDIDQADAVVTALADIADCVDTTGIHARLAAARGMVAAARGDHATARRQFEDAIDGFERCRAPYDAAVTRIELAQTLHALGRGELAQSEAERARQRLEAMGAALDAARADASLDADAPDDAASDGPANPLSPRETEVLGALARGMTNREISERLCISEHTVHRHVANILRKLDVPSRAAAAAHGARMGLLQTPAD